MFLIDYFEDGRLALFDTTNGDVIAINSDSEPIAKFIHWAIKEYVYPIVHDKTNDLTFSDVYQISDIVRLFMALEVPVNYDPNAFHHPGHIFDNWLNIKC